MEINILIDDEFQQYLEEGWLEDIAERILLAQGVKLEVEVGLVITNQERVQELNRTYRSKDEPTDVLAFALLPAQTVPAQPAFIMPPDEIAHLGEIIISCPQAEIQAHEHGHSTKDEIIILLIHGVLHLLGYDHEEPEMAKVMHAREAEILSIVREEKS